MTKRDRFILLVQTGLLLKAGSIGQSNLGKTESAPDRPHEGFVSTLQAMDDASRIPDEFVPENTAVAAYDYVMWCSEKDREPPAWFTAWEKRGRPENVR